MATIIQIRRRPAPGADPVGGQLAEGEFGYAFSSDKLFIGGEGGTTVLAVGGASFISLLTATPGVATADKAVVLDSNTEIDSWGVTGQVTADSYKTSATVGAGFVKNDASGNLLFGQTGEQSDLDLTDLADVTITTPATNEVLTFNGSEWVNLVLPGFGVTKLDDLSDVTITLASSGDFLRHTGSVFINTTIIAGDLPTHTHVEADITDLQAYLLDITGESIGDLSDVTIISVASGELLTFTGTVWENQTLAEVGVSPTVHTHVEADITDLQAYLLDITGEDFTDLADTPANFIGAGSRFVKVNSGATALEFVADPGFLTDINSESIDELSDVTITFVASGEILKFDGSNWINNTLAEAGVAAASHTHSAADVVSGTLADARISQSSVTQHETALTITESQISDLQAYLLDITGENFGDLSDVNVPSPTINQLLEFDGSVWVPTSSIIAASVTASGTVTSLDFRTTTVTIAGFVKNDITGTLLYGQPPAISLDDLDSVFVPSPSNNDVLTFLVGTNRWEAVAPTAGGPISLNNLTDVTLTSPNTGEVLTFTGTVWENQPAAVAGNLDSLTDVIITAPTSGEFLRFSGTAWVDAVILLSDLPAIDLDDLADVAVAAPNDGDVLTFNNTSGDWEAAPTTGGATDLDSLTDVTITAPATGSVLVKSAGDWIDSQVVTLTAIEQPNGADLVTFTRTGGSRVFDIEGSTGGIGLTSSLSLTFRTGSGGAFLFKPAGTPATTGLMRISATTGTLLFGETLVDADIPTALTLTAIEQPDGSNIMTFARPSGVSAVLDVEGTTGGIRLISSLGLTFRTASGAFFFFPNNVAAATGLMKISATTGTLLFGQSLLLSDLPAIDLDDLADVSVAAPNDGDVLTFNNTSGDWEAAAPTTGATDLDGLSDVTITFPATDALLQFDGSQWIDQVNLVLDSTAAAYWGTIGVNGTWRAIRSGNDLSFQRREVGVEVEKAKFTASSFVTAGSIEAGTFVTTPKIDQPSGTTIMTFVSTSGTNFLDVETVAGGMVLQANDPGGNSDLVFRTSGTGIFAFQPGGGTPASGLMKTGGGGIISFGQSVTDAEVPDILTLTTIKGLTAIELPIGTDILTFVRQSGTSRFEIIAQTDAMNLVATGSTDASLIFVTLGVGTFKFFDGFTAAATGLVKIGGSGTLLFSQSLLLSDLPTIDLDDLGDVDAATPNDGDVLAFNNTSGNWEPSSTGGGAMELDDLTDVTLTSEGTGDFLRHDGSVFVNTTIADGDVPNTLTLGQIDTPTGTAIMRFSRSIGTHDLLLSSAGQGMTLTSTKNFNMHTAAASSGTFSFHPETVAAATGLMKIGGTGVILFGELLADADIPTTLTLDAIQQPVGTDILTFTRTSGTGSLEVEADSSSTVRLIASTSLDFQTTSGDFFFKPSLTAAAPGLMKIDTTFGRVLFGQTLADADVPDILTLTRINDANGNEVLDFFGNVSAVNNVRIINRATGLPPAVVSVGDDADVGLRFDTKGNGDFFFFPGGITAASAGLMRIGSSGEIQFNTSLTDADVPNILTLTRIDDTNGNEVLEFLAIASAVNNVQVFNRATGLPPGILSRGLDADIGLRLETKGSGDFFFFPGGVAASAGLMRIGASGEILFADSVTDAEVPDSLTMTSLLGTTSGAAVLTLADVAIAVNSVSIGNSITTAPLEIKAIGTDAAIDLTLHAKGTGAVKIAPSFDFAVDGGDALFGADVVLTASAGTAGDASFYLGPVGTDGTWRITRSGDDLLLQQREAGTYVTKVTHSGA